MPPLNQPRGWRYFKSRLRLLNRPQALGTLAVLLVAGVVLTNYWRRQPAMPIAPTAAPAASAPTLAPANPLSTLAQPAIEPSVSDSAATNPLPNPQITPSDSGVDLFGSPTAPTTSTSATSTSDRVGNSGIGIDSFSSTSSAATPATPLGRAIANQTARTQIPFQSQRSLGGAGNSQSVPEIGAQRPSAPTPRTSSPYMTSPPAGATGYTLPPNLAPSQPTSGLPASRPEVTGGGASVYGVAPAPSAIAPVTPIAPPAPQLVPGQPIGEGNINTFGNP